VLLVGFTVELYYDARSYKRQASLVQVPSDAHCSCVSS